MTDCSALSGHGELSLQDGQASYSGSWSDNKLNGPGRYTFPDGSVYEGEYTDNRRNGYGVLVTSTGLTIKAFWELGAAVRGTVHKESTQETREFGF
jgi:hypothetical protein